MTKAKLREPYNDITYLLDILAYSLHIAFFRRIKLRFYARNVAVPPDQDQSKRYSKTMFYYKLSGKMYISKFH